MKQVFKQKLLYFVKFIFTAVLIIWILNQVDREKFIDYFSQLNLASIAIIIFLGILSLIVQFKRWQFLIESNSINYDYKDLIPSFFAGFAFRLMIPGGHAEISKVFLLSGRKRGKVVAFGIEKFFLAYMKIALIVAVIPLTFPKYTYLCISLLVVMSVVYILLPKIPFIAKLQEKEVNNHFVYAKTLFYSGIIFLISVYQYQILLERIHEITFLQTAHVVVYLWAAGIIPFSISGLGFRESLAVYFLQFYGIPAAHAVAASLFLFAVNSIFPALTGVYYIYDKRQYLKELKNSVQSTKEIFKSMRNAEKKSL